MNGTDADALLAAVLADPADDLPRLIYADWLDETSDPHRAEFIRVQIALAAGIADPGERVHFTARESVLLAAHRAAWLAPLKARGEAMQNPGTHGQFARGFVECVWMPAAVYLEKAHKLFARAPVQDLRLTRVKLVELAAVLAHPATRKLRALDVSDVRLGDAAAALIAEASGLQFEVVRLRGCNITHTGAQALLDTPPTWQPQLLDLTHNPLSAVAERALATRFPGVQV